MAHSFTGKLPNPKFIYLKQLYAINYKRELEYRYDANAPIDWENPNKTWIKYVIQNAKCI